MRADLCEDRDFLLDVLHLVVGILEVDDLEANHGLGLDFDAAQRESRPPVRDAQTHCRPRRNLARRHVDKNGVVQLGGVAAMERDAMAGNMPSGWHLETSCSAVNVNTAKKGGEGTS